MRQGVPLKLTLEMLGLYLDILIISHTICCMLSIQNELTLQKEL